MIALEMVHAAFLHSEPCGAHSSVREHRTAIDWAEEIKYLVMAIQMKK